MASSHRKRNTEHADAVRADHSKKFKRNHVHQLAQRDDLTEVEEFVGCNYELVERRLSDAEALSLSTLRTTIEASLGTLPYSDGLFHNTLTKVFGAHFRMWNRPRVCNLQFKSLITRCTEFFLNDKQHFFEYIHSKEGQQKISPGLLEELVWKLLESGKATLSELRVNGLYVMVQRFQSPTKQSTFVENSMTT